MKFIFFAVQTLMVMATVTGLARGSTTVEVAGVAFPRTIQVQDIDLELRGKALLRYMAIIKAYAGALYLPVDTHHRQVLDPVPRRLELSYFQAISASDFAKATRHKLADNLSPAELSNLSDRVGRFNALYRDVQPGDRYALTYIPGKGTELSLNGETLGRIEGDDFGAAVFSIWLGPRPIDRSFKAALLGKP